MIWHFLNIELILFCLSGAPVLHSRPPTESWECGKLYGDL